MTITNPEAVLFLIVGIAFGVMGGHVIGDTRAAGNVVDCNLVRINGQLTNGNNATLSLRQLNIQNPAGSAVVAWATSPGDGSGLDLLGHHGIKAVANKPTGSGAHFRGFDAPGWDGGDGFSIQGFGIGAGIAAHGGRNSVPGEIAGPGAFFSADAGVAAGLQVNGSEAMAGLFAVGGPNGQGALFRGGTNGGPGALFEGRLLNYPGIAVIPPCSSCGP